MSYKKNKNKFSNTFFVLLIVGIIGIFIFVLSINEINKIDRIRYETISNKVSDIVAGITGSNEIENTYEDVNSEVITNKDVLSEKAKETVINFYNNVNKSNFTGYYTLLDKTIRSNYDIRTYFSKVRIDRFLKRINGRINIIQIDELPKYSKETNYSLRKGFNYTLNYNIAGKAYKEQWEVVLMSYDKGNKFYINSLFCTTKDCGKLPFYNY